MLWNKEFLEGLKIAANISSLTGGKDDIVDGIRDIKQELSGIRTELCIKSEIKDDWCGIFKSIDDGTYRSKYKIGDYKICDFGKEGKVYMQIAAFDEDTISGKKEKAAVTWIGMYCLSRKREMKESGYWFPIITNRGGWEKSDMRLSLDNILFELPDIIQQRIVLVDKENENGTTADSLWLLSVEEYQRYSSCDKIAFTGKESFWLRNATGHSKFYMVSKSGGLIRILSSAKDGVLVGFCTN